MKTIFIILTQWGIYAGPVHVCAVCCVGKKHFALWTFRREGNLA